MQNVNDNAEMLKQLAFKYENKEFLVGDPSWFMHQVEDSCDKELLALLLPLSVTAVGSSFFPKFSLS